LLVNYARKVSTPTKIELLFPPHLKPPRARKWEGAFFSGPFYREVAAPKGPTRQDILDALAPSEREYRARRAEFDADPHLERAESEVDRLIYGAMLFDIAGGSGLLELVVEHRCDYLLTENPWILTASDALKKSGVWPSTAEDTLELLQLSLRSVGVFIEVVNPITDEDWGELGRLKVGIEGLGFSHFYSMEDRALRAYQGWFARLLEAAQDKQQLMRHGRAAFYHRFPFMLYAHDQLRYHSLYAQRFRRDNRYRGDHRFFVSYHLNAFYVMLAALLDNVAWIWNYALKLGFKEHDKSRSQCVLTHKEFRKRLGSLRPDFVALLDEPKVAEWLQNLTLKRHPAVHREPLFLTEILEEGTGKVLSDTASVVVESDRWLMFDLLGAANADLGALHRFLGSMEELPVPVLAK